MSRDRVWSSFVVLAALALGATGSRAQAPVEAPFYAVAYVDAVPAARQKLIAALRAYRDASRKDQGYVRFDLLEQIGWAGHFAIVETWSDRNAFDAHAMAAHAKQFRDAIQPVRVSGYDERPYKALAAATTPAIANGEAVHVVAHVDIGPGGQANAPALLTGLAEASRKEPGNLRFDVLQHAMRGNHFTVVETWRNQQALEAHVAAAHTRRYRDTLQPVSGSPLDERLYKAVE
jgi:quinol monooxygenase YgiN